MPAATVTPNAELERQMAALESGSAPVRWLAAEALTRMGRAAVPALVRALAAPSREVRRDAVRALADIGPGARVAALAILARLDDPDTMVRLHAAKALRRITPRLELATGRLVVVLRLERSLRVKRALVALLGSIGPGAVAAVGALNELLEDPDLRVDVALALRTIDPANRRRLAILVDTFADPREALRRDAARALGFPGGRVGLDGEAPTPYLAGHAMPERSLSDAASDGGSLRIGRRHGHDPAHADAGQRRSRCPGPGRARRA